MTLILRSAHRARLEGWLRVAMVPDGALFACTVRNGLAPLGLLGCPAPPHHED
jgi:hypothetical protein